MSKSRPVRQAAIVSREKTKTIIKHEETKDDEVECKYDTLSGRNLSDCAYDVIRECSKFTEENKNYCYLLRVTRPDRLSRSGEAFFKVGHTSITDDRSFAKRILEHNNTFKCFIDHELLHIIVVALFESPTGKGDEIKLHKVLIKDGYQRRIQVEKGGQLMDSFHKETYDVNIGVFNTFVDYALDKQKKIWLSDKYTAPDDTWNGKSLPESCRLWCPCGSDDDEDYDSDDE